MDSSASNELKKRGIFISPGGVRSVWIRHGLEIFKKRLNALEEKMAQENLILTEPQLQAIPKIRDQIIRTSYCASFGWGMPH